MTHPNAPEPGSDEKKDDAVASDAPATDAAAADTTAPGAAAVPDASTLQEMPAEATLVAEGSVPAPRPDRELEEAPRLLRNAAWVLLGGALIPFTDAQPFDEGIGWMSFGVAKVVALLGCFVLAMSVYERLAKPVPYGLGALAKIRFVPRPEPGKKPKNALVGLLQSAPSALHWFGLLLIVASIVLVVLDPQVNQLVADHVAAYPDPDTRPKAPANMLRAVGEVMVLLLGGCTLAHIFAYKKGGSFSPLYPFAFLAPAIMALLTLYGHFFTGAKIHPLSLLGTGIVGVAAAMGVHTIVVAMIQAKKEGDAKREAALEARRAARKSRGGGKGGGKSGGKGGARAGSSRSKRSS